LKILIVSRGVPTEKFPLNGIFEFDQAKALKFCGHEVAFLALDFRSLRRLRKLGFYTKVVEGIKVINLSVPLGNIEAPFFNWLARMIVRGSRVYLKKVLEKPDVIHAHFFAIGSLALELKRYLGVPMILTEHNSLINEREIPYRIKLLAQNCYSQSDVVLAVSRQLSERIKLEFKQDAQVVANMVDVSSFALGTKSHFSYVCNFISVGELIHRKGYDILLDAFGKSNFGDTATLTIYGGGKDLNMLRERAIHLGISGNVFFRGEKSRTEIANALQNADVFVLASRVETFGVVFIEAMATGLPVIATSCGGPENFVNDSNGILIPTEDVSALANALVYMKNYRHKFDKNIISAMTKKNFEPKSIVTQLVNVYSAAIKSNKTLLK